MLLPVTWAVAFARRCGGGGKPSDHRHWLPARIALCTADAGNGPGEANAMSSVLRLGDVTGLGAVVLPRPVRPQRRRSQLEEFLVLRRNLLELWGEPAYSEGIVPGRFLGRAQLLLNDPAGIRHVLVGNADNYERNAST